MARRVEAGVVQVSHDGTQAAERQRERERPPSYPLREERAAWEAEPDEPPAPTPRFERGRRVVVRQAPAGGAVLSAAEVEQMRFALMRREANSGGAAATAAVQARRALGRRQIEGESA